jgi:hypothetical protein
MNKKNKQIIKKNISAFEIFILVASILAFSYFVGNEFKFVSATNATSEETPSTLQTAGTAAGTTLLLGGEGTPAETAAAAVTSTLPVPAEGVAETITTGTELTAEGESYLAGTAATGEQAKAATAAAAKAAAAEKAKGTFFTRLMGSKEAILGNAVIAFAIWGVFKLISLIPGVDSETIEALGEYLSIGYGVGAGAYVIFNSLFGTGSATFLTGLQFGLVGLIAAGIIFIFFYQKEKIDAVQFICNPWQPAKGGGADGRDDCTQCNNGQLPCTKYKCQSLGLNCELLNEGTSSEICIWNHRDDILPPTISSWKEALPEGYSYTPDSARLPPDKGVIIKANTADGCVPPFTKLTYGVSLDKPGTCRIDTNRTDNFDKMRVTLSDGYFIYNHTILSFPAGLVDENNTGISVSTGGTYETYVRCQSKNGYSNVGTFVFKYCVQKQPDTTAPSIELVNPSNNMPIQFGSVSKVVDVYTNKPANCKWSHTDQSYNDMPETMSCSQNVLDINANMLYHCSTNLTGLKDGATNTFYFRCKSLLTNESTGTNPTSYKYTMIGTRKLVIDSISPADGTELKDSTQSIKVILDVKTSAGYKDGEATCSYSDTSGTGGKYVLFANTNSYESTQELWLDTGSYDYTIKCCDLGGNCETKTTSFRVETDSSSPAVIRAYNDASQLKIATNEDAVCVYDTTSCSYNFEDGLAMTSGDDRTHSTGWDINKVFYIKCKDSYGNLPSPDQCSFIARPVSSY